MISITKQKEAAKGMACIEVPAGEDPAYPLFIGTKLVGNATNGKFVNGARYVVKDVLAGAKVLLEDTGKGDTMETTVELISKNCILAHALTYQKVQGISFCGHNLPARFPKQTFQKMPSQSWPVQMYRREECVCACRLSDSESFRIIQNDSE